MMMAHVIDRYLLPDVRFAIRPFDKLRVTPRHCRGEYSDLCGCHAELVEACLFYIQVIVEIKASSIVKPHDGYKIYTLNPKDFRRFEPAI
jgi:hypothetical protein